MEYRPFDFTYQCVHPDSTILHPVWLQSPRFHSAKSEGCSISALQMDRLGGKA